MIVVAIQRRPSLRAETYAIPILLNLALIASSLLLDIIKPENFLAAIALLALVVVSSFGAQVLAARQLHMKERDALYEVFTAISFGDRRTLASSAPLSDQDVLAIESTSREVWVYAYDLRWENSETPFTEIVKSNLRRGVHCRYLVSSEAVVLHRVRQLRRSLYAVPGAANLVSFRSSEREKSIGQFGITIYNPSFLQDIVGQENHETTVVWFPHFADFGHNSVAGDIFLSVRGSGTMATQEAFSRYWSNATPIPDGDE
jgi:hypothetical protein